MEIYKCNICGNVVEKHLDGKGQLVCCGEPMKQLQELSGNEGNEKHKPVIEKTEKGILVKIGSIPHPMGEEHSIKFIQVEDEKGIWHTKILEPTDKPEAEFNIKYSEDLKAREYCNLHGLWANK